MAIASIALLAGGCQRRNEAKERIQAQRQQWEESLPDSLKKMERQTDSIRLQLQSLAEEEKRILPSFRYVDNPREVEGYYIAGQWAPSYPLKSTGLVARITKGEKLELIAALAGGAHFDRIRVEANGASAESSAVPHDQALNYRMTNLNTVCFSDSAANSCASLIAANPDTDIRIVFLNGGKATGSFKYPKNSQKVMYETWTLYDTRSRISHDERMLPLLAKKKAALMETIGRLDQK